MQLTKTPECRHAVVKAHHEFWTDAKTGWRQTYWSHSPSPAFAYLLNCPDPLHVKQSSGCRNRGEASLSRRYKQRKLSFCGESISVNKWADEFSNKGVVAKVKTGEVILDDGACIYKKKQNKKTTSTTTVVSGCRLSPCSLLPVHGVSIVYEDPS